MRLIDADALSDNIKVLAEEQKPKDVYGIRKIVCELIVEVLDVQPTIDPVKHGHWIEHDELICYESQCSVCGAFNHICKIKGGCTEGDKNYCPNCGADMRGAAE